MRCLPAVKRWVFCVGALSVRFGEAGKRCADGHGTNFWEIDDNMDLERDDGDLGSGIHVSCMDFVALCFTAELLLFLIPRFAVRNT